MKIARIEREKERESKESLAVTLIVLTCWIESIEGKEKIPVGRYQTNNHVAIP